MKTKVVKSILSVGLIFSMVLSLFSGLTVSAETTDPTPEYLFYEDFTTQTAGSAPTNFYKDDATHKYTYADATKETVSSDYAVISNDSTHGNYLELVSTTPQQRAKVFLSEAVDRNDGTIVIEYDGLINIKISGNDSRKYIYATFTGQNKDRTKIDNQASEILNNKGSDVGNAHGFSELVQITDGTYNQSYAETYDGRKDENGNQIKNSRLLYYYNDPIKNAYSNESNCIQRTNNTWQHYKMELNLADGTQQLWIDGKASEIWQDKSLHARIGWEGYSIDAISFMSYGDTSNPNWLIDNIKVYKKDKAETSPFSGDIIQNTNTGVVTANFTSAMKLDGIALYDADGNDVTKSVSLTADGKTATITPKSSTKGLYYVKVGTYAGGTVPAQTEKTVELNWEKEPISYLYYEDFEGDEVGNAPSNVYTHQNGQVYSEVTKTKVTTDYATIAQDTATTNTTKYLNFKPTSNDYNLIQMYLGDDGSKYDKGTVVFEFDGWIDVAGNGNNNSKYFYIGTRDTGGGDKIQNQIIMNYMGTNKQSTLPAEDRGNAAHYLLTNGGNDYIRNSGGNYILKKNNAQWNNYKIEINLKNGECKLWLNGQISETWINDQVLYRIGSGAWGKSYLDSFVLRSDATAGGITTTPWKLDNIKVYLKDTADTSPFETITSEKNGDVTVKFSYAVNAEDLSVYNADGEKINGKFVMSEENKTATFTPDRIEDDGLYYVKVAKLASGTVTTQTTKEFNYAPGRTKMVISGLNTVVGTIAPTFTLTHTDGAAKEVVMIVAAYKGGKLVKADVKTESLTTEDKTGAVATVPTIELADGEADTVKAFAWIGGTNVPICNAGVYTTINN